MDTVSQLYPEYYILKVNGFDQVAKSPLEEWIYYLNTGEIPSSATAPGLEEARERLKLDSMTKDELAAYYRHLDNIVILRDNIYTEREEGRAEGEKQKAIKVASYLKQVGSPTELIIGATGLSKEEVENYSVNLEYILCEEGNTLYIMCSFFVNINIVLCSRCVPILF